LVGSSFSNDYRLCDIFQSFLFEVVSFMDFSTCLWVPYACLTNPISRVMSMPFDSKRIRLATKSTPYFKI
jgi:hypothetical protein